MTTNWQILDTRSKIADGLITKVIYGCLVQLENEIDRKIGEIELTGDITTSDFIPFNAVTEQVIVGWVKASLGVEQVTAIETALQNSVTARKAAKEAETEKNGLPWRQ
jgi:hypothetical protein